LGDKCPIGTTLSASDDVECQNNDCIATCCAKLTCSNGLNSSNTNDGCPAQHSLTLTDDDECQNNDCVATCCTLDLVTCSTGLNTSANGGCPDGYSQASSETVDCLNHGCASTCCKRNEMGCGHHPQCAHRRGWRPVT
jgi:hypothetical protein